MIITSPSTQAYKLIPYGENFSKQIIVMRTVDVDLANISIAYCRNFIGNRCISFHVLTLMVVALMKMFVVFIWSKSSNKKFIE
jgi:hypothetical protein